MDVAVNNDELVAVEGATIVKDFVFVGGHIIVLVVVIVVGGFADVVDSLKDTGESVAIDVLAEQRPRALQL